MVTLRNHRKLSTLHCIANSRSLGAALVLLLSMAVLQQNLLVSCGVSRQAGFQVTYVANDGFLIECGHKKVAIDTFFGGFQSPYYFIPPDSIIRLMKEAKPPFDDLDLIAVTHAHLDHFTAEIVSAHLHSNQRAVLICPPQAEEELSKIGGFSEIRERVRSLIIPVDSAVALELTGMNVEVLATSHGSFMETDTLTGELVDRHRNVQHFEYLVTVGGHTLLHTGDSPITSIYKYRALNLEEKKVDIAFIQRWNTGDMISFTQEMVRRTVKPERIILMHLLPEGSLERNPTLEKEIAREIIVPQQMMEKWVF